MPESQIKLYYKNVTAEIIGNEHGITDAQLKTLAQKTSPLIPQLNKERKAYRDLPHNRETIQKVKKLTAELKDQCENLVVLGIGGSALGNIALQTTLNPYMHNLDDSQRPGPRLFVFDNIDPQQLTSFLDWASDKLDKTIFNVISKSGQTAETAAQFMIIHKLLLDRLGREGLRNQIIATTDREKGTLRKIADDLKLRCLEVPDGVGGRFSVLSDVGLFSAAMCGIDIDSLLEGARDMDKRVSTEDFYKNPAAINAAINYHFYNLGKKISVMMPYSYHLKDLADWYRQLWAESLGKAHALDGSEVRIGPTPVKALGTTDQHSQVQLYREGPNDKLFTFLQVDNFDKDMEIGPAPDCAPELGFLAGKDLSLLLNSEKKATEYALLQSKRPCLTVNFPRVTAYTVGQFIYLYEVTTSLAGALFGIDPYDQPAVELGKEAAFALMGKNDFKKLAQQIQPLTEVDGDFLV
ncbi:MAG: glucose-6-phosphate isomerase [Phycisphaerae bacterium]|nr:glucose-6-phosphate isomerase [Phycisphaerae bacterium]MDD5381380.1 glucose-6-phosphate isomerase [Phycisphaerae bacterium]